MVCNSLDYYYLETKKSGYSQEFTDDGGSKGWIAGVVFGVIGVLVVAVLAVVIVGVIIRKRRASSSSSSVYDAMIGDM